MSTITMRLQSAVIALVVALGTALLTSSALPSGAQAQPAAPARPMLPPLVAPALNREPHITYPNGVTALPDVTYRIVPGFRPLKLDIYVPKKLDKPIPIVIWIHGGGYAIGDQKNGFDLSDGSKGFRELAARGYLVVSTTYRFSSEARFPAQLDDVRATINWVKSNAATYNADTKRVVLWGSSAGGHLASLAGVSCSGDDCVQGVVDWFGLTDFRLYPNATLDEGSVGSSVAALVGCDIAKCSKAILDQSSVLVQATAGAPPFFIVYGDKDSVVPAEHSQKLENRLRTLGVKVESVSYPVDHIFIGASPDHYRAALEKTYKFIDAVTQHGD